MRSLPNAKLTLMIVLFLAAPALAGAATPAQAPAVGAPSQAPPDLDLPADGATVDGDGLPAFDLGRVNQCIQITVWARNPDTGECREFGSPCSVPSGWEIFFDPETCTNG
jgi:hypothetical protein